MTLSTIVGSWAYREPQLWSHLGSYVIPDAVFNSVSLLVGVSALSLVFGTSFAILTCFYQFPGRKIFHALLILPLSLPAYVTGFIFTGFFEFSGPFFSFLREQLDIFAWVPIRSYPGLVFVMSASLYPYVYLMACQGFRSQGQQAMECGRMLGMKPRSLIFRLVIPLSFPWMTGGALIVAMECLSDFGTVSVFSYDTLTTAIYKSWFGFFSKAVAGQVSTVLLVFVLLLIWLQGRNKTRQYTATSHEVKGFQRIKLTGIKALGTVVILILFLSLVFLLPVYQLASWSLQSSRFNFLLPESLGATLGIGLTGAGICLLVGFSLTISNRLLGYVGREAWWVRTALVGYSIPGNILAVGVFIPLAWLDQIFFWPVFKSDSLVLGSSIFALLTGLTIRFSGIGYSSFSGGMKRISGDLTDIGNVHGVGPGKMVFSVYAPMLNHAAVTGFILILVDIMKEMPLTLMLRPMGWDTLSIRIFELTSEGEWERAAWPALWLVFAGMVPLLILIFQEKKHERDFENR